MAVRKQRATTNSPILETDINVAIKKGKSLYKNYTNEFYIYETLKGSGYYFPDSYISDNFIQHWKLNFGKNRWECLIDNRE